MGTEIFVRMNMNMLYRFSSVNFFCSHKLDSICCVLCFSFWMRIGTMGDIICTRFESCRVSLLGVIFCPIYFGCEEAKMSLSLSIICWYFRCAPTRCFFFLNRWDNNDMLFYSCPSSFVVPEICVNLSNPLGVQARQEQNLYTLNEIFLAHL